jgi:hypothetical protein
VTFTPAANGSNNGSLTLTDNSGTGTQALVLKGWAGPADFSLSAVPSSQSVAAGSTASYTLALASGGGFSGTVQLACAGAPSKAACAVSKSSVVLNGTSTVTINVTVTTTAPSVAALSRQDRLPSHGYPFSFYGMTGAGPVVALLWVRRRRAAATIVASVLAMLLISCGGGGNSAGTGGGGGSIPGTPPGTYNLTLSGASGSTTHTVTITLTVP